MFRNAIERTPLTDNGANSLFDEAISRNNTYLRDISFQATLRAIVFPKLKEGEHIYLSIGTCRYKFADLDGRSTQNKLSMLGWNYDANSTGEEGFVRILDLSYRDANNNQDWMDFLIQKFTEHYTDYEQLPIITDFFKKAFNTVCFVDRKHKNVAIFVSNIDLRIYHYLQAAIPAFMPWYFENGVSDEELELLQSLRLKKSDKYLECLRAIASKYDFRSEAIKTMLRGFETRFEKEELLNKRSEIQRLVQNIQSYNQEIARFLEEKADAEIVCLGLEAKINSDNGEDSEIMDYFLTNKSLILEGVTDTDIDFAVKGYIDYYDEDMSKTVISNTHSTLYERIGCPVQDAKALFTAIFVDKRYRLRTCAAYRFHLRGTVEALRNYHFSSECEGFFPNPHIQYFNCMGNYIRTINDLLVSHNYITAIEQCAASSKSLNFSDSTVIGEFGFRITNDYADSKILEAKDGSLVSPREAVRAIMEEKIEEAQAAEDAEASVEEDIE